MKNTVFGVVLLSIFLPHFGVSRAPYSPAMSFKLSPRVAYFLSRFQFYNSEMQNMKVPLKEIRWYASKIMTADNWCHRSVYIRNQLTKPIQVSCSTPNNEQIGTLTLKPGFSYFFRFLDHNWIIEPHTCVASYTTTKKISFDVYKGKAPSSYQNGFAIREDGIYLFNGASYELYRGDLILFLGIGGKLTNGFTLAGNDYSVIQFENRKNEDVYLRCNANDGNGNEFTVGGTGHSVSKGQVYKLAIEAGNFEKGFVECFVGAENSIGFKVYGVDSYGQYKYGSEYYFIDENDTVTFETIVNVEVVESKIANTDPNMHLIQIENQMSGETSIHCWGKEDKESPSEINVGLNDYRLQSGEIYTFSIPVDSFINGYFWCYIGGIYPNHRLVEIYGYRKSPRSNHYYAIHSSKTFYEIVNGEVIFH